MKIDQFVDLTKYNTFRVNSNAKYFTVLTEENIDEIENIDNIGKSPFLVLGEGSNILFADEIFNGTVICNKIKGIQLVSEDEHSFYVKVGAGESWHNFVMHSLDNCWFGLENLVLIPGTVGAAPVQNIGAYGVEVGQFIDFIEAYNFETKTIETISRKKCSFQYRNSIFKEQTKEQGNDKYKYSSRYCITYVHFKLLKTANLNLEYSALKNEIEKLTKETTLTAIELANIIIKIRREKLPNPIELPNAGSFFQNPIVKKEKYIKLLQEHPNVDLVSFKINGNMQETNVKLSAGQLIELSGLKGKIFGNVSMYKLHALIMVNMGDATGKELYSFAKFVQNSVRIKFNVHIDFEPLILSSV